MKIITNEKLIKRNRKIGQILSLVSLAILGAGLYMSFQQNLVTLSFAALLVGFLTSQLGIYYGSRWGRSPRPDEQLTAALKGLDNRHTLYHYTAPVPHLLTGPSGIFVLLPYAQKGTITYEKNRWRQKGGNLYLKIFAQEGMGRPDLDMRSTVDNLKNFIVKVEGGSALPEPTPVLVFTNPKVVVQAADAPAPTVAVDKLKDFIRSRMKDKSQQISLENLKLLETALPEGDTEEEA